MTRNRLRLVVKTFPAERIWNDFLVAERARMCILANGLEARSLRRAYLEGIFQSDEWLAARARHYPVTQAEERRLKRLCIDLRRDMTAFDHARGRKS